MNIFWHMQRRPGQTILLFAVLLVPLIALVALGIDGTNAFLQRRNAQSIADVAALAGSVDLPGDADAARTNASLFAEKNGYTQAVDGVSVAVTTPYKGDASKVEVSIDVPVRTLFLAIVGFEHYTVHVRAVALHQTGDGYAIFAGYNGPCDTDNTAKKAIDWSGGNVTIDGAVHSNSGFTMSGTGNDLSGGATYVCGSGPKLSGNTYAPAPATSNVQPWPATFTTSQFPCTFNWATNGTVQLGADGAWWVGGSSSSGQLMPGVYCGTGSTTGFNLSSPNAAGSITLVAPGQISLTCGGGCDLKPYLHNVLIYSNYNGDKALNISSSNGTWEGILYTPNGEVQISGGGNKTFLGSIVAERIHLSGSNWQLKGIIAGHRRSQLVE